MGKLIIVPEIVTNVPFEVSDVVYNSGTKIYSVVLKGSMGERKDVEITKAEFLSIINEEETAENVVATKIDATIIDQEVSPPIEEVIA